MRTDSELRSQESTAVNGSPVLLSDSRMCRAAQHQVKGFSDSETLGTRPLLERHLQARILYRIPTTCECVADSVTGGRKSTKASYSGDTRGEPSVRLV